MATIPSTSTYAVGEKPTAAKLNANGKTALDFLLAPPVFSVGRIATAQSIPNATNTAISFDTEIFDPDNMWTSGGNVTVNTAGIWQINCLAAFVSNATGRREVQLYQNGSIIFRGSQPPVSGVMTAQNLTTYVRLAAADVLTMQVYQDSGGALNTSIAGGGFCMMQGRWVST